MEDLGGAEEKDAVWGDLICGQHGEPQVQVLSIPNIMANEDIAKHRHPPPYHPGRPHCAAATRKNPITDAAANLARSLSCLQSAAS